MFEKPCAPHPRAILLIFLSAVVYLNIANYRDVLPAKPERFDVPGERKKKSLAPREKARSGRGSVRVVPAPGILLKEA